MKKQKKAPGLKKLTLTRETLLQIQGGEPITDGSCGITHCKDTDYCPASRTCPP